MKRLAIVTALTMGIVTGLVAVSTAQGVAGPAADTRASDLAREWTATLAAEEVSVLEVRPSSAGTGSASAQRQSALVDDPTALREVAGEARERAELIRDSIVSEGFDIVDAKVSTSTRVIRRGDALKVEISIVRSWVEVNQDTDERTEVGDSAVAPLGGGTETKSDPRAGTTASSTARPATPRTEAGTGPSRATTARVSAAATGDTNFDHEKFAAYGKKWTGSPYDGDAKSDFNPDYPHYKQNCANFVSQMFNVAGWKRTGGINPNDEGNWDDNLTGPAGASDTWASAAALYRYATKVKDLNTLGNIWNAVPGNTYFMDWDGNSKINHVAAVTGRTEGGTPRISQKTGNRHNMLLTTWKAKVDDGNPNVKWFGLRRTMK